MSADGWRSTGGAALLDFLQPLVLIFGLNRDPIVKALEFACEGRQCLVGLLQLSVEMFDQRVG